MAGSGGGIARVRLYDSATSATGTPVIQLETTSADGTVFETYSAILFPRPVRISTALKAVGTGITGNYWIYVGGR